jgi:hypothetical protein
MLLKEKIMNKKLIIHIRRNDEKFIETKWFKSFWLVRAYMQALRKKFPDNEFDSEFFMMDKKVLPSSVA